jgi:hypothetical protein
MRKKLLNLKDLSSKFFSIIQINIKELKQNKQPIRGIRRRIMKKGNKETIIILARMIIIINFLKALQSKIDTQVQTSFN